MKENSIFKGSSLLIGCILMIIGFSLIEYFPAQEEFKIILFPFKGNHPVEQLFVLAIYIVSIGLWLEEQPIITYKILSISKYRISDKSKVYIRRIILSIFLLFWVFVILYDPNLLNLGWGLLGLTRCKLLGMI